MCKVNVFVSWRNLRIRRKNDGLTDPRTTFWKKIFSNSVICVEVKIRRKEYCIHPVFIKNFVKATLFWKGCKIVVHIILGHILTCNKDVFEEDKKGILFKSVLRSRRLFYFLVRLHFWALFWLRSRSGLMLIWTYVLKKSNLYIFSSQLR